MKPAVLSAALRHALLDAGRELHVKLPLDTADMEFVAKLTLALAQTSDTDSNNKLARFPEGERQNQPHGVTQDRRLQTSPTEVTAPRESSPPRITVFAQAVTRPSTVHEPYAVFAMSVQKDSLGIASDAPATDALLEATPQEVELAPVLTEKRSTFRVTEGEPSSGPAVVRLAAGPLQPIVPLGNAAAAPVQDSDARVSASPLKPTLLARDVPLAKPQPLPPSLHVPTSPAPIPTKLSGQFVRSEARSPQAANNLTPRQPNIEPVTRGTIATREAGPLVQPAVSAKEAIMSTLPSAPPGATPNENTPASERVVERIPAANHVQGRRTDPPRFVMPRVRRTPTPAPPAPTAPPRNIHTEVAPPKLATAATAKTAQPSPQASAPPPALAPAGVAHEVAMPPTLRASAVPMAKVEPRAEAAVSKESAPEALIPWFSVPMPAAPVTAALMQGASQHLTRPDAEPQTKHAAPNPAAPPTLRGDHTPHTNPTPSGSEAPAARTQAVLHSPQQALSLPSAPGPRPSPAVRLAQTSPAGLPLVGTANPTPKLHGGATAAADRVDRFTEVAPSAPSSPVAAAPSPGLQNVPTAAAKPAQVAVGNADEFRGRHNLDRDASAGGTTTTSAPATAPNPTTLAHATGALQTSLGLSAASAPPAETTPTNHTSKPAPFVAPDTVERSQAKIDINNNEAHVSVQTDGGALSLHVRVRQGVADVSAEGQGASQLGAHGRDLEAYLSKEGLTLGRFTVDDHRTPSGGTSDRRHSSDPHARQDADENPGTSHAESPAERPVSGDASRVRRSGRVHIKA